MADDDIGLPKSTMAKAIKDRLPENLNVSADARETIMRCCGDFVQMVATSANELCEKEKKSTISPEHVLKSLEDLGFNPYLENLNAGMFPFPFFCARHFSSSFPLPASTCTPNLFFPIR